MRLHTPLFTSPFRSRPSLRSPSVVHVRTYVRTRALLANAVRRDHRVDLLQPSTTTAVRAGQHHGHVWRNAQVMSSASEGGRISTRRGGARQRCNGSWPSSLRCCFFVFFWGGVPGSALDVYELRSRDRICLERKGI